MKTPATYKSVAMLLVLWLAFAIQAHAQINNANILDNAALKYQAATSLWGSVITNAATRLFWTLTTISLVWTGGMMILRKADIGEFFAEFFRFIMFTGFYWWLLLNGPAMANSIYAGLRQLATDATSLSGSVGTVSPSSIVDIGFEIFNKVVDKASMWSPVNSAVAIIIAAVVLVVLALVGINMLLLLISGWILAYAGVFYLGFGGSRWTSDMAIGYFKTVLNVGMQLFSMVLIVGIGKTFLDDYCNHMSADIPLSELGVVLVAAVVLLYLIDKIPQMVGGMASGAGIGGVGQFGAGAALSAAGMAAAAAATGGAMLGAAAANAAGGGSALMAAFSQARENVSSGTDVMSSLGGGGGSGGSDGGSSGGGDGAGTGGTPFAQAAGFSGAAANDGSASDTSTGAGASSGGAKSAGSNGGSSAGGGRASGGSAGGRMASSGGAVAASGSRASGGGASPVSGTAAGSAGEGASGTADAIAAGTGGFATGGGAAAGRSGGDAAPAGSNAASLAQAVSDAAPISTASSTAQTPSDGNDAALSSGGDTSTGDAEPMPPAGTALGTAGRIAVDAGANLAKGAAAVAKARAAGVRAKVSERIANTTGGQIAAAIRTMGGASNGPAPVPQQSSPASSNNGPASGSDADLQSEVAAFVNRGHGNNGTTA
jgi:type IV secretion system protein VirB6/type IV secretion system protein TrbL